MKFKSFIIIIFILLMIFIFGCQYILQLPKQSSPDSGKDQGKGIANYEEIKKAAQDTNNLVILAVDGKAALAAKSMSAEFEKLYNIKANVFALNIEEAIKTMKLEFGRPGAYGYIDLIVYPAYLIGLIQEYTIDLDKNIKDENLDIKDYLPNIFNLTAKWQGGAIKGIPIQSSIFSIVYRADSFLESGISTEKFSYDQYSKYMENFKNVGQFKNFVSFDPSQLSIYWSDRYWSLGGLTTTEDWKVTVNNETSYKAFELLKVMKNYAPNDIFDKSYDDIAKDFINGNSPIFEGYPDFLIADYKDISTSINYPKIGVLPVPSGTSGNFSQINAWLVGINKTSIKREAAWNWLKLYTSKEKSKLFLDEFGIISPRISTFEDGDLNSKYVFLKEIYNLFKNTDIKTRYKIQASYNIWEAMLNDKLKEALIKDKSAKETMEDIEKKWKDILIFTPPMGDYINEEIQK